MKAKISKRQVDATDPQERDVFIWDTDLKGFGLKVTPVGNRIYILQYRIGGRLRRYTIGKHGSPWTPDLARKEASRLIGLVAQGSDPAEIKTASNATPTIADLAKKFMAVHVAAKTAVRTGKEYSRLFDQIIIPAMGKRRVTDVTRADIARLHHAHRHTPFQANRVLALLGKFFNWAERHGYDPPPRLVPRALV